MIVAFLQWEVSAKCARFLEYMHVGFNTTMRVRYTIHNIYVTLFFLSYSTASIESHPTHRLRLVLLFLRARVDEETLQQRLARSYLVDLLGHLGGHYCVFCLVGEKSV